MVRKSRILLVVLAGTAWMAVVTASTGAQDPAVTADVSGSGIGSGPSKWETSPAAELSAAIICNDSLAVLDAASAISIDPTEYCDSVANPATGDECPAEYTKKDWVKKDKDGNVTDTINMCVKCITKKPCPDIRGKASRCKVVPAFVPLSDGGKFEMTACGCVPGNGRWV